VGGLGTRADKAGTGIIGDINDRVGQRTVGMGIAPYYLKLHSAPHVTSTEHGENVENPWPSYEITCRFEKSCYNMALVLSAMTCGAPGKRIYDTQIYCAGLAASSFVDRCVWIGCSKRTYSYHGIYRNH
jgi:hypothetical protein